MKKQFDLNNVKPGDWEAVQRVVEVLKEVIPDIEVLAWTGVADTGRILNSGKYLVDTRRSSKTISLPIGLDKYEEVTVWDAWKNASLYNIIVTGTIGEDSSAVLNIDGALATFVHLGNNVWAKDLGGGMDNEHDVNIETVGLTTYVGMTVKSTPATATSAALWAIKRIVYDGTSRFTQTWADGDLNFDNIWDNRAILSYS